MSSEAAMTTLKVLEQIRQQYARLNAAVDRLGPAASTAWVTEEDGWTAQDVLAHLIHYAGQIAFGLGAPGSPPPYVIGVAERLPGEEWNRRAVAYWRDFDLVAVRAELDTIVQAIIEQVGRRTDEEINATGVAPWYPADRPLWQFIGGDTFAAEWPAHAQQMEAAARRLGNH